ncbi:efflux RND transporter periplasmic adaptor subunit [Enterovirga sp.]|jgi:RND family efflux transporter MFP subunit|uniref:efflux RND transporter periplasmic adaptor subunit n=1 Tax=Enterovirga sp. TaxID=2026350 RepID=UPI00262AE288|nr:efflux RND transporter periplasmic adaptor subunit [Enterovirga sp.]MDB5591751.1 efflux transporter periplasmic adaptor subunit [Enterovirga sp.]
MRQIFLLVCLILAIGPTLPTSGFAQAPGGPPPTVTVAKPVVRDVVEYDDFTGRFDAADSVEIRARVSGYLERVGFQDGATIKKGDVLFVIDRRPYQAALDQAKSSVASAQGRLTFAQGDLERAQSLQRTGNIAEQLVDQRRQAFTTARADLDSAEAALRNAQLNYNFTEIRAPIAGRIGRKLISEGNLVSANETLLTTIVTLDPIYFYFDVDERSYLAYSRNLLVARQAGREPVHTALVGVTDEREPKRPARLDFLDNRIDQASGTIRARAVVENKDGFLVPGLFGQIRIAGSQPQRGVLVPDEAIGTDQDRRIVWTVAEDGTVASKVVTPGSRIDGYRLIRSGLTGDETIVITGLQRVRAGGKVTPQRQELPATRS